MLNFLKSLASTSFATQAWVATLILSKYFHLAQLPRAATRVTSRRRSLLGAVLVRRKTHVLVIDTEGMLRDGLCALLQQQESLHLDGAFVNARSAVRTRGDLQPHVVVTHFPTAMKTGPQTILHLKRRWPRASVLVLAPNGDAGARSGSRRSRRWRAANTTSVPR